MIYYISSRVQARTKGVICIVTKDPRKERDFMTSLVITRRL